MDMKKILQAMDGASTKPVEGSNDMAKFRNIVTEGASPHKVTLPVQMAMSHYNKVDMNKQVVSKPSLLKTYFKEAEEEVQQQASQRKALLNQYAQVIAERVQMKEGSDPCWKDYKQIGMKKKGGKQVPNCVPKESMSEAEGEPEGVPHVTKELLQHIVQQVGTEGAHAIVKSLEWGDGAAKELLHMIVHDLEQDIASLEENEISGHSMGFTGGVGPGIQSAVAEEHNSPDTVKVDIPLLIRLFEFAREDAKTDMDLHNVTERLIRMSEDGRTLTMDDYNDICPPTEQA